MSSQRNNLRWVGLGLALVPLALLALSAHHYYPFLADDALISLRYSERLLNGQGLTWTDGKPVEGYSNLLWVLLSAAMGLTGLDLVDGLRVLGLGCTSVLLLSFFRAYPSSAGPVPATAGATLLACSGPVIVWSIGGLEQSLVAMLLGLALVNAFPLFDAGPSQPPQAVRSAALPLSLLCLSRPDGPLFTACFALALLLHHGPRGVALAAHLCVLPVLTTLSQLGFRLAYYGEWVPNTAHMKVPLSFARVRDGLEYVRSGLHAMLGALLPTLAALLFALGKQHGPGRILLLSTTFLAWGAYVAFIGGDIFPAGRHLVPLVVLLGFGLAHGLDAGPHRGHALRRGAVLLCAVALLTWHFQRQRAWPQNRRAEVERWEFDGMVVGTLFGRGFSQQQPLMAVTAAGAIPYFSALPSLDMLGLNDWHIARQPPYPGGGIGHDHGDGTYVLDREPDLIHNFIYGGNVRYPFGREMERDPRFGDYQLVRFAGHVPHTVRTRTYVRRSGRVGVTTSPTRLRYPAYLLRGTGVSGQLLPDGSMGAQLGAERLATTSELSPGAGIWQVTLQPPQPRATLRLVNAADPQIVVRTGKAPAVKLTTADAAIRISIRPSHWDTMLSHVLLTRMPDGKLSGRKLRRNNSAVLTTGATSRPRAQPLWTFDEPGADGSDGWVRQGEALSITTGEQPVGQGKVRGHSGRLVNSFHRHKGDRATGSWLSPAFSAKPDTALSFLIGGGKDGVGVRLLADGVPVANWAGRKDSTLRRQRLELTQFAGRTLRVEIYDDTMGGWGHTLVDQFELESLERDDRAR